MFRRHFLRYRLYYCVHIPGLTAVNEYDTPSPPDEEPQTGLERVVHLFKLDKHGEVKKEVTSTLHLLMGSSFFVGTYGGLRYSKYAFENYIDANQTTRFLSSYEFKRKIHDHIAVQFCKYFIIYGAKGLAFSSIFLFSLIIIAAFRDKDGILEYAIGSSLAGTFVRINYGLKGMFAGGFLGCLLGTALGTVIWVITKISSISIQDVRQWSYDIRVKRKQVIAGVYKKAGESEYDSDVNRMMNYYSDKMIKKNNPDFGEEKFFIRVNSESESPSSEHSNVPAAAVINESKS